jgi:hypothetical protein
MENHKLWMNGGMAGIGCVGCYLLAILIPWPETQLGMAMSLVVLSGFPLLGIVFSYGLYSFVAEESENAATFPWPPGDRGLVDIGPFIALFWVVVAVRLIVLGRKTRGQAERQL